MLENFSLHVGRPFTAYHFALYARPEYESQFSKLTYTHTEALRMIEGRDYRAAISCLKAGIELVEAKGDAERAIALHFRLAEVLSDTGQPLLGAEEIKKVLVSDPKTSRYGEAVAKRLKYLYEADQIADILEEVGQYRLDNRCQSYLPQILYVGWAGHKRKGLLQGAHALQEEFLGRFSRHPLAVDMYFDSAMMAVATADCDKALRLFDIIEYRFPKSILIKKVKKIRQQIQDTSLPKQFDKVVARIKDPVLDGVEWLIHEKKFLARVEDGQIRNFEEFLFVRGFAEIKVNNLAFTPGTVWVATNKGGFCYERKTRGWTEYAINGEYFGMPVDSVSVAIGGAVTFRLGVNGEDKVYTLDTERLRWSQRK